ncbi:MAG: hypothetical protein ACFFE8_03390 [Candidatus Heimdallarchaeota archaeon]
MTIDHQLSLIDPRETGDCLHESSLINPRSQYYFQLLADSLMLQSKLALFEFGINKAQILLQRAYSIAEENNFQMIASQVAKERQILADQIARWKNYIKETRDYREILEIKHIGSFIQDTVYNGQFLTDFDVLRYVREMCLFVPHEKKTASSQTETTGGNDR